MDNGVFYANNFMKPNDFYTLTEHVSISNSVLADLSGKTFDNYYIIAEKLVLVLKICGDIILNVFMGHLYVKIVEYVQS